MSSSATSRRPLVEAFLDQPPGERFQGLLGLGSRGAGDGRDERSGALEPHATLAELLARLHADRRKSLRTLVDALAGKGPLRLGTDEAVDTVWALTSPELHQLLTRLRGWTQRRYRDWLADSLAQLLLRRSRR